jgi:site-specific DNA-methyltransferase (adenine-specific)
MNRKNIARIKFFDYGDIKVINCDMFDTVGLQNLPPQSVNAIITDFPYGTLNKRNEWDKTINYDLFWTEAKRICTPDAPTITTAQMPFTAKLVSTNYKDFKYTLIWEKSKATGYLNAKKQPLRAHEDIVVFYDKQCKYHPQMTFGEPYNKGKAVRDTMAYGKQTKSILVKNDNGLRYPRSVQYFITAESEGKLHPTQKPVSLFQWLIQTYTDTNNTVLDPCMGSGTTAVACIKTGRKFIGFEKDPVYFEKARQRIEKAITTEQLSFLIASSI